MERNDITQFLVSELLAYNIVNEEMFLGEKGTPEIHPTAMLRIYKDLGFVFSGGILRKMKSSKLSVAYDTALLLLIANISQYVNGDINEGDVLEIVESYKRIVQYYNDLFIKIDEANHKSVETGQAIESIDIQFEPVTEMDKLIANARQTWSSVALPVTVIDDKDYTDYKKKLDIIKIANEHVILDTDVDLNKISKSIERIADIGIFAKDVVLNVNGTLGEGSVFKFPVDETGDTMKIDIVANRGAATLFGTLDGGLLTHTNIPMIDPKITIDLSRGTDEISFIVLPTGQFTVIEGYGCSITLTNPLPGTTLCISPKDGTVAYMIDEASVNVLNKRITTEIDKLKEKNITVGNLAELSFMKTNKYERNEITSIHTNDMKTFIDKLMP